MQTQIKLIIGLGNPGPEYEFTRHNVGFWFVQKLAVKEQRQLRFESKFHGATCQISHNCRLLLPMTYMNESGIALKAITNFYKISAEEILVVHDDLDFPPGIIRLKHDGGHGGHKGLRNIIDHLHNNQFYRLRIGIGHPGDKNAVLNYVLGRPSKQQQQQILDAIDQGLAAITDIIKGNIDQATRLLHGI